MQYNNLPRLLILDDEPLIIRALERALRGRLLIVGATDVNIAVERLSTQEFDAILVEVSVIDQKGKTFVQRMESSYRQWLPRLILTTGGREVELAQLIHGRYGCPVLPKPIDPDTLVDTILRLQTSSKQREGSKAEGLPAKAAATELSKVLVIDDEPDVLKLMKKQLGRGDYEVLTVPGPVEALSVLWGQEVAVVICDYMMPVINGYELLTLVRQNWPETVCIMLTGSDDIRVAADVVNRQLVHYFITKPWKSFEFRNIVRDALKLYQEHKFRMKGLSRLDAFLRQHIREQAGKAAISMARAVDARDRYTYHHSQKVAVFSRVVGQALKLDEDMLEELRIGALLHDVGKIGVPDEVLRKPASLTQKEFDAVKMHPEIGASIVEPIEFPWNINAIVRQHHENFEGGGYPDGVAKEDITLLARIIRVVDSYDAMSSDRPYRKAKSPPWVHQELQSCQGAQFDPDVTRVFLQELDQGRIAAGWMPPATC